MMNLALDPAQDDARSATAAFVVLAKWYAANSAVRRLWAVSEAQRMRVVVTLVPTHDDDDIYPAWLANGNLRHGGEGISYHSLCAMPI